MSNGEEMTLTMNDQPNTSRCALAAGSGQLTDGARHYGITTRGAARHIEMMMADDADWSLVTGFDRACIGELLAFARKQGLQLVSPNTPVCHGEKQSHE